MCTTDKHKSGCLEVLRICFDFAVIVIMVVALIAAFKGNHAAQDANKLNLTSLRSSYVPWLQITSIRPSTLDSNRVEIAYTCKNFANAPALNLDVHYTVFGMSSSDASYTSDALMPGQEAELRCTLEKGKNQAEALLGQLKDGTASIGFEIHFTDIFSRKFVVSQERKCIDGKYRMTQYQFDGLDDLAKPIGSEKSMSNK